MINLEDEIVATRFDPAEGACFYTLLRDGKRYTAKVMAADLDKAAQGKKSPRDAKAARRAFLHGALETRLYGAPDPEPPNAA